MTLEMDKRMIEDRCDALYVVGKSRYSNGVKVEHPIAAKCRQPVYFESKADKKFFIRAFRRSAKKKK